MKSLNVPAACQNIMWTIFNNMNEIMHTLVALVYRSNSNSNKGRCDIEAKINNAYR